jgi:hypothetical protein
VDILVVADLSFVTIDPLFGQISEPQNIEYRTAELRRLKALRSIFLIHKIDRIYAFDTCPPLKDSTFNIDGFLKSHNPVTPANAGVQNPLK